MGGATYFNAYYVVTNEHGEYIKMWRQLDSHWDDNVWRRSQFLVSGSYSFRARTGGLCGNFNSEPRGTTCSQPRTFVPIPHQLPQTTSRRRMAPT